MKASYVLLLAVTITSFTACVSSKKYDLLRVERNSFRHERDSLRAMMDEGRYVEYELERTKVQLAQTDSDHKDLTSRFQALESNYKELLGRYDEIIFHNQSLLAATSDEKVTLNASIAATQLRLDSLGRVIRNLESSIRQKDAQIVQLTGTNTADAEAAAQACQRKLAELNSLVQAKDAKLNALRSKINQALLGFTSADLNVSESNGKIYVSLSQNLLFKSGSDQIDWKGKQAIQKLAEVLNRNPDINITVEGHTDIDGSPSLNWDLSVRRATAVVKVLTTYSVDPTRITASGRGEYFPVASNATADGKGRNRRTEIILSPKLDELYEVINQ